MGVLIKGMEMPKTCDDCPLLDWDLSYIKCGVVNRKFKVNEEHFKDSRAYDCPLIEIPPHGRLIDADAFTKDECNYCDGACEALPCDCLNCKSDCRCDFMKDIADAPTIIPAEPCNDLAKPNNDPTVIEAEGRE